MKHECAQWLVGWLVGWLRSTVGRTSVLGRRTDPVLRSTCSRRVTTMWVNRPLYTGQPTRPTQPFILSGSTRSKAIHQMSSTSLWWRHLVNACVRCNNLIFSREVVHAGWPDDVSQCSQYACDVRYFIGSQCNSRSDVLILSTTKVPVASVFWTLWHTDKQSCSSQAWIMLQATAISSDNESVAHNTLQCMYMEKHVHVWVMLATCWSHVDWRSKVTPRLYCGWRCWRLTGMHTSSTRSRHVWLTANWTASEQDRG